jgi:FKBP-type peptidyl-prolyl cis-trans isomerase FkpA
VTRFLLFFVLIFVAAGCSGSPSMNPTDKPMPDSGITTLQKTDTKVGTGNEARKGMYVQVHYTGWLYDNNAADRKGKQFDNSRGKAPFAFRLGDGEVIPGWDEGVVGMKVGGARTLIIPPALGYGPQGAAGQIPPNATLIFDVELVEAK